MMAALAIGGLYIVGKVKTPDGKTIAEQIAEEIAKQAASGAAGAASGAAQGVVKGTSIGLFPAANPETGVGDWKVPISGGYMQGSPLSIVTSGNVQALWNLLPFLPDY